MNNYSGVNIHGGNANTQINTVINNGTVTMSGYLGNVPAGSVVFNPYAYGYIANYPDYCPKSTLDQTTAIQLPKGTYTFIENRRPESVAAGRLLVYSDSEYAAPYTTGTSFTIAKDNCYGCFVMYKSMSADIPSFYYGAQPMVVRGDELPNEWKQYVGKDYTAGGDGTINNITPYYPITNMFVKGSSGAVINTEYYADSERVVQNLTDTIILLGGTV